MSLYYYLGVVRAMYWSQPPTELPPIRMSCAMRGAVCVCIAGMFCLGLFPGAVVRMANAAADVLGF
jgi:NADH-quinone oxidoreductase subunit N